MRLAALAFSARWCLAVVALPQLAAAESTRDFVFTDVEGHMVLRFVGAGAGGLDAERMEEVINVSLSTMVHDRLRADAAFEAEPVDSHWGESTVQEIRRHLSEAGLEFPATIDVECRSSTCRVMLEHIDRRNVPEHQALLGHVQLVVQALIEAAPASFDPAFLMAAYDQDFALPHVKVFLRRAPSPD